MARILIYEKWVKNPWFFSPGAELPYGDMRFSLCVFEKALNWE